MRRPRLLTVAAIPVAFATAVLATSQTFVDRWLTTFPAMEVGHAEDGSATLSGEQPFGDRKPYAITLGLVSAERVRDVQDEPSAKPTPVDVPPDLAVWRVVLDVRLDPTLELDPCQVVLLDEEEREYSPGLLILDEAPPVTSSCTPPFSEAGSRPARYPRHLHFVLPADVEPSAVRVWVHAPRYAQFEISRG